MSEPAPVVDAEVPAPIIVFEGKLPDGSTNRVVATYRVTGPPEMPPGWYVTCEEMHFDALAKPGWLEVSRLYSTGDDINEDYTIILEAALGAIAERMNKVREKVRGKK